MPQTRLRARQKSQQKGRWWALVFLLFFLAAFPQSIVHAGGTKAASSPERIEVRNGKLTVRLAKVSLRWTMNEVGRLSGAEIVWLNQIGEEIVSANFTALPFAEALGRILKGKNFLLFYTTKGEKDKLTQIWISASTGKRETPFAYALATEPSITPVSVPSTSETLQNDEELADGEIALSSMALDDLVQIALGEKNQTLRLDAISLLGQEIQENPRVKALLTRIAREDADPSVRQIATLTLGEDLD